MEFLTAVLVMVNLSVAENSVLGQEFFRPYDHCDIKKEMLYLSKEEKAKVSKASGQRKVPGIFKTYKIKCQKNELRVFLLSDKIRSHYQKAFVAVEEGKIKEMKIVKFKEPQKYKAPRSFVETFFGKTKVKMVDGLTGATLTRSSLIRLAKTALEIEKLE